jgi:hypothetical protein
MPQGCGVFSPLEPNEAYDLANIHQGHIMGFIHTDVGPPHAGDVVEVTLTSVANVRLMLQQQQHPGAKNPVTVCRQVIDCAIQQTKLISSRDNGPGIDTGDILCEGYLTRAALLPPATAQSNPWDWLAAEQDWQTPGLRATFQPLAVPQATEPPRPTAVQVPSEGVCWLGDLALLETPGVLPLSPRAVFAGASLLMIGQAYGPGGIGLQVQPGLGEAISFALKPNRVLVIETGDSLNLIAERYGTTVQTLRAVNTDLAQQGPITTATGVPLNVLAARHGAPVLRGPFNTEARRRAGFSAAELQALEAADAARSGA